jgi:hypothetical protein
VKKETPCKKLFKENSKHLPPPLNKIFKMLSSLGPKQNYNSGG